MEEVTKSFSTSTISPVLKFVKDNWSSLNSKSLFQTEDVQNLVKDISNAVEKILNLEEEVQGPNYAIIGARGTGKTWLMENMNVLLNGYFKSNHIKARSFYLDMSSDTSTKLPFDQVQEWLSEKGNEFDLNYHSYVDIFQWLREIRNKGFRFFYFADELHHVYGSDNALVSEHSIKQIYNIGKSKCALGFISSSSYQLEKYAFKNYRNFPNLNNTVYIKRRVYPLREESLIAEYCKVDSPVAHEILWKTGGIPRYMNNKEELPISKSNFWEYMVGNKILASILAMFYLKYDPLQPKSMITLNWNELFSDQCLPGDLLKCVEEHSESYFFHSKESAMNVELLLPYTIKYIVEYFETKTKYLDHLVFTLLTEKKVISLGHHMESVILKHSQELNLGAYVGDIPQDGLQDGVYQIKGKDNNGLDGFILHQDTKIIDIIQVKCGYKNKLWNDGFGGMLPVSNIIIENDIVGKLKADNMKGMLRKAARNWQKLKGMYPGYSLGRFYFITTNKVSAKSKQLINQTTMMGDKIQDSVIIGYAAIKTVIQ